MAAAFCSKRIDSLAAPGGYDVSCFVVEMGYHVVFHVILLLRSTFDAEELFKCCDDLY